MIQSFKQIVKTSKNTFLGSKQVFKFCSNESIKFDKNELKQNVASYELLTLETHKKNSQVQDVIFELTYKLDNESKYNPVEQNLILYLNLGDINLRFNKLNEAKMGLETLVEHLEKYDGDKELKNTLLPQSLHRLAGIALKQKDIELAEKLYQQVVDLVQEYAKETGDGVPISIDQVKLLANTYEKLGNLYRLQQKLLKAVEFYQQSHSINQQALPPRHPFAQKVQTFLGDTLRKLEKHNEALPHLQAMFNEIKINDKSNASLYIICSSSYSLANIALQKYSEALEILQQTEKAFTEADSSQKLVSDLNFANVYHLQAICYSGIKENDKADLKIQKALDIATKILPEDHQLLKTFQAFKSGQTTKSE